MISETEAKMIVDSLGLTPGESQLVRAISRHETQYGAGWGKGQSTAGEGSNNWGAIQTPCSSGLPSFEHQDHRYVNGEMVPYTTCFRVYATPDEGARDVARVALRQNVRDAVERGDLRGAVAAMYDNHYFGGFSTRKDESERKRENVDAYTKALKRNLSAIRARTGEVSAFREMSLLGAVVPGLVAAVGLHWWLSRRG